MYICMYIYICICKLRYTLDIHSGYKCISSMWIYIWCVCSSTSCNCTFVFVYILIYIFIIFSYFLNICIYIKRTV